MYKVKAKVKVKPKPLVAENINKRVKVKKQGVKG
jgi:hypothetical protein